MKKQILSTVFSALLSLFLSISLLLGSFCVFVKTVICKPENLIQIATTKGYTQEVYEEIAYSWENFFAITGVSDPSSIMTVLTPEKVREHAVSYISDSFVTTPTIDYTVIRSELSQKVREYVSSTTGSSEFDEELEQNIKELVAACMTAYGEALIIPTLHKMLNTLNKIQPYLIPASILSFSFGFVLAVFLFFLQRKRRNVLYFVGIATATNALFFLSIDWIAKIFSLIDRLPIQESPLRTLLSSYLQFLFDKLQVMGMDFLMAALLLVITYCLCYFLAKHKTKTCQ